MNAKKDANTIWLTKRKILPYISITYLVGFAISIWMSVSLIEYLIRLDFNLLFNSILLCIIAAIMIIVTSHVVKVGYRRWINLSDVGDIKDKDYLLWFILGFSVSLLSLTIPVTAIIVFTIISNRP